MGGINKAFLCCGWGADAEDTWQRGAGMEAGKDHRGASAEDQLSELGGNGIVLTAVSAFPQMW